MSDRNKDFELPVEASDEGKQNLTLWKSVERTHPDMTKLVSFGKRKYTAIDPQWQLRIATALWGPYGLRWGLRNIHWQVVEHHAKDAQGRYQTTSIIVKAEFFYPHDGKEVSFEIMNDDEFSAGDEVVKKLVTNTRSKALSWLGFSADVFLGKFDDQAYVKTLKAVFDDQDAFVNTIVTAIRAAKDAKALAVCKTRLEEIVGDGTLDDTAVIQELNELIIERKRELAGQSFTGKQS